MMYQALQQWNAYDPPKTPKKAARTKWSFFAQTEEVKRAVMVKVRKPAKKVAHDTENAENEKSDKFTTPVKVKREAVDDEDDGNAGSVQKKARPFTAGEIIEID